MGEQCANGVLLFVGSNGVDGAQAGVNLGFAIIPPVFPIAVAPFKTSHWRVWVLVAAAELHKLCAPKSPTFLNAGHASA